MLACQPTAAPLNLLEPLPTQVPATLHVGGRAKQAPGDFVVEELPAYEPCGQGDHLFIWLQKTGMPAHQLLQHVGRSLQVAGRDIGCAGLKDSQAITRQYISVPAAAEPRLAALADDPRLQVLGHRRHGNKLRTGHLRGNRFVLRLTDCPPHAAARVAELQATLRRLGMPNYFGDQRFGRGGATLAEGLRLLRGDATARRGGAGQRSLHRLALSSVQSALFNQGLARRLRAGTLHQVLPGEVMQVRASGGPFVALDLPREQRRLAAGEIVGAGPMFGPKMRPAQGLAGELEAQLLHDAGLTAAAFAAHRRLLQGTRRAHRVHLDDLRLVAEATTVTVEVSLPPGSYATVLLREMGSATSP